MNKNLIWLTDIHLNFLSKINRLEFYEQLKKSDGEKILITGDIAEAPSISDILKEMASATNKPIYFVLGNHDYYHGHVDQIRSEMVELSKSETLLNYLPATGPHILENNTIIIGQDSWADGRYGDYTNSNVALNDSRMIYDFFQTSIIGKYTLLEEMQKFADKDAKNLKHNLNEAIKNHPIKKVLILIHVPPFIESCMHEGEISNDDFLPFFASKITGDVLKEIAENNEGIDFLTLCGHTHSSSYYQPLKNLTIKGGAAQYSKPEIQEVVSF